MSATWEDPVIESSDDYGGSDYSISGELGESYELDDSEAANPVAQRQMRARRAALRRAQAARRSRAHAPAPTTVSGAVQRTQAAVREVDLTQRVQADTLASALAAERKRIDRSQIALVATLAERQLQASFPNLVKNSIAQAGLRAAPLLLLKPSARRRDGIAGYATDPQIMGIAVLAGLTAAGEWDRRRDDVPDASISRSASAMIVGQHPVRFLATAVGKAPTLKWRASDDNLAEVDSRGFVTAKNPGDVVIELRGEDGTLFDQVTVTIT